MKTLNRKLFRDLWIFKSQFISIFFMTLLGILCFSGIHSYMDGMQISVDKYYIENNLQDLWINSENFSNDDLNKVKNVDNVKDAERKLTIVTKLKGYDDVKLETNFIESNNISKFFVEKGQVFEKNKNGVWIDSYLANNLNIKIGDYITMTYRGYNIKEKVLGLVMTPDHVYCIEDDTAIFPTHKDYGFVYLSINEFPEQYIYDNVIKEIKKSASIFNDIEIKNTDVSKYIKNFKLEDNYVFNQVMVDVDDVDRIDDTRNKITDVISSKTVITGRKDSISYVRYQEEIDEGNTYSGVFTLLFLFIAILSVVTTMYRFVRNQRTQIGTLKALGIKKSKITLHYITFGFFISSLASILGIIVGKYTLGTMFLDMQMEYYEVPNSNTVIIPLVYYLAIATVLLVTLATYLSCRKILVEKAADAIRVEMPVVKASKGDITQNKFFNNMSFSTKWNIRDILRNKGRTLMMVVGVTGCTMILVCAFGMFDTMDSYIKWEFEDICNFDYKLSLDEGISQKNIDELMSKYGSETSRTYGIELGGYSQKNSIMVLDVGTKYQVTNHDRNPMKVKDNGIYLTEKLSKTLNKNIGDEVEWKILGEGKKYKSKIIGLSREPQNQQFVCTKSYLESLDKKYKPDTIYTDINLSKVEKVKGVSKISSIATLKDGIDNMMSAMRSMVVILIVASAILGFVIIYNLGILSFVEKKYQFATLKVLGFKDKKIKKIFIKQNIWLTLISIILGLPLGYYMTDYIFIAALGENFDFPAIIGVNSYIYSAVGTILVAYFVNVFLARKIKSIDMVSSLKGNE